MNYIYTSYILIISLILVASKYNKVKVTNTINLYHRVDSEPYLPSIGLGLIGLTVYISYSVTPVARSSIIFYTFY